LAQDSDLWTVTVWNETSQAYEESVDVSLGIGADASEAVLSATVSLQITLPSVEDAWHLANGHRMTLRMETDLGEATQASVKVFVPQTYGFNVTDATELLGMTALVERTISFDVTNTGNGQESYTIELLESGVPEGWSVTPMMSTLTLSKDETRTQQFTVFAPESFEEGEFPLTIYVNSEDEEVPTYTVEVTVQAATIDLVVVENGIPSESNDDANTPGSVVIPIQNTGTLDAPSVIVYLKPTSPSSLDELSVTISVPAGQTVNAEFTDLTFQQGNQRFEVRVDVVGAESTSDWSVQLPDGNSFSLEYRTTTTPDGEDTWFTLAIVLLGILVIYGGTKAARSRGGSKF
jgi:hypothetical protein